MAKQAISQRMMSAERRRCGTARLSLAPVANLSSKERLPPGGYARKLLPKTKQADTVASPIHQKSDISSVAFSCNRPSGANVRTQYANSTTLQPACQISMSYSGESCKSEEEQLSGDNLRERYYRNDSKLAISSLRERYSQPDRFEDGFACVAAAGHEDSFDADVEEDALLSASKSLLSSFDKDFEDSRLRGA
uniref:Uncharacterized protein n=1 Tax=Odontella aurita TaxID=265563 RepID=A0A7S4IFI2_9STRA